MVYTASAPLKVDFKKSVSRICPIAGIAPSDLMSFALFELLLITVTLWPNSTSFLVKGFPMRPNEPESVIFFFKTIDFYLSYLKCSAFIDRAQQLIATGSGTSVIRKTCFNGPIEHHIRRASSR